MVYDTKTLSWSSSRKSNKWEPHSIEIWNRGRQWALFDDVIMAHRLVLQRAVLVYGRESNNGEEHKEGLIYSGEWRRFSKRQIWKSEGQSLTNWHVCLHCCYIVGLPTWACVHTHSHIYILTQKSWSVFPFSLITAVLYKRDYCTIEEIHILLPLSAFSLGSIISICFWVLVMYSRLTCLIRQSSI